ncbi:unnamed protein product [Paramecium sonneborni]|uniref:Leucine-rich repeat protein n=1 Tax=Paramecium sonneborni TaxID=65129 RepID=A0A8S1KMS8_9CILI|nr:unnamed protein product [Paramecium sonneborni]
MKKKQTKKNQNNNSKLSITKLIKLMDDQHKRGQYKDYPLYGLSFANLRINIITPEINKYLQKFPNEISRFYKMSFMQFGRIGLSRRKINFNKYELYNYLRGDSLQKISTMYPNITHLDLSHNLISNIEDLNHLKNFKNLQHLDLCFNPVKRFKEYRKIIFELVPDLQNLDDQQDIDDSDDNSSRDNWESNQEESESEASFNEESSDEDVKPKKRKKVKK